MHIAQTSEIPTREKQAVALSSVFAALILTVSKGWIGWWTGSLGILSEAAHSALDLLAAGLTYVSVRFSDRPADSTHHFGHGKVENLSAFLQTGLLLITCIWIIFEAVAAWPRAKGVLEDYAPGKETLPDGGRSC